MTYNKRNERKSWWLDQVWIFGSLEGAAQGFGKLSEAKLQAAVILHDMTIG